MQPTTMLPKLADSKQTISFSEGDGVCSAEVYANEVVVSTNAGNHNHGSSKVKLKNLVDYNWEPKFYPGNLLAVHMSGKYLAYCIKAPNSINPGTWTGMVRVVYNPEMGNDRRALIKGMKGEVQDLAFAHIMNQVVLACIDEHGNFYVHEIELTDSGLRCTLACEIREEASSGGPHRVVWCPYIPDDHEAEPDDVARLLLTTHENKARMWNISVVVRALAASGGLGQGSGLGAGAGCVAAGEHAAPIVDAAFSPDGTALATAASDGLVMFYQVYTHNESAPRCLHKWQPHGGAPLSCLAFLDNHNNTDTDVQFWKFAVTGAENNTIIKIWSCKSWNCLQTITFAPSPGSEPSLGLKAMLDASANYLLLSDFKTRSLYVLNMARDRDDTMAYCRSISEFLLSYPVLSFYIFDAEEVAGKCESSCSDPFHRNGSAGDAAASPDDFDIHHDESPPGAGGPRSRLRLYVVQPKGLQEAELLHEPPPAAPQDLLPEVASIVEEESAPTLASSILQQQSQQLKNLLMRSQTQPGSLISQRPESPPAIPQPLNLMTPDAFSSPGKRDEDDPPLSATPDVSKPRVSTGSVTADAVETKFTSGGSSPSREVQEIMSHNDDDSYYKGNLEEDSESLAAAPESPAPEFAPALPTLPTLPTPPTLPTLPALPALPDLPALPELPPLPTTKGTDTSWPQISLAQITEANQRKASSDKSGHSLNAPLEPGTQQLEQKIEQLTEQVTALCRSVSSLRSASVSVPTLVRQAADEALQAHAPQTAAAVETALTHGWERIARVGEGASARAASAAGVGAARALEPLAAALQHELAAKLSATDALLRDNIQKLVTSKSVTDRLSAAVSQCVTSAVRDAFREAMKDSVLPAVERAHQDMFRQVNQAFQQGTKEFAAHTEASARAAVERGAAGAVTSLRAALTRHAEALCAAPPPLNQQHLAAMLRDTVRPVLEKEVEWWVRQARSVQMSRAHSPATPAGSHCSAQDRQMQVAQIQSLISSGDVNGAFQLALSASDLALVMAACRAADPGRVFAPPCQLRQHVLLSLIQQLAADIHRDTALKHRYLEEAIMNLDTSNAVTREHLPVVVRELRAQVMSFLGSNGTHALARKFKMLLIVADSLAGV